MTREKIVVLWVATGVAVLGALILGVTAGYAADAASESGGGRWESRPHPGCGAVGSRRAFGTPAAGRGVRHVCPRSRTTRPGKGRRSDAVGRGRGSWNATFRAPWVADHRGIRLADRTSTFHAIDEAARVVRRMLSLSGETAQAVGAARGAGTNQRPRP